MTKTDEENVMKTPVVLTFSFVALVACMVGPWNNKPNRESSNVVPSPTPPHITSPCTDENYRLKTDAELSAMSPAELIAEKVRSQMYPVADHLDYAFSTIGKIVRKNPVKYMPALTEIADNYNPDNASQCERLRFFVAYKTASDIDEMMIRLRGTREGLSTIEALEGALRRMKELGFDNSHHIRRVDYDTYLQYFRILRGISSFDKIIRETLRTKKNVDMSDEELLEFSNFLVVLDPTYPVWSETVEYQGHTVLKKPERYFKAFFKFQSKSQNRKP